MQRNSIATALGWDIDISASRCRWLSLSLALVNAKVTTSAPTRFNTASSSVATEGWCAHRARSSFEGAPS